MGTGTAGSTAYPTAGASSGMGGAVLNGNGTVASSTPTPTAAVFQGAARVERVGWWLGMAAVGGAAVWAL